MGVGWLRSQEPDKQRWEVFDGADPYCDPLFRTTAGNAFRTMKWREQPVEVLPGIFSNDIKFLRFKDKLTWTAHNQWEPNVDEKGRIYGNGVTTNLLEARHVSGFSMIPATWPMADNYNLRLQEGLVNEWVEPWHRVVAEAFIRLFFSDLQPESVALRKGSSSMAPFFEKDTERRLMLLRHSIENAEVAGNMMLKGEFRDAFLKYGVGGCFGVVYRDQPTDLIQFENGQWSAKDRPVSDLEYAITGGRKGHRGVADKSLDGVDWPHPKGFFRMRKRSAMGGGLGLNGALMPHAHAVRKHLYRDYPSLYHHTTRDQLQADFREWKWMILTDVSNHDQLWPVHLLLPLIVETLLNMGYPEWWVKLYETKNLLPIFVTGVGPNEPNLLIGDYANPDLTLGQTSGNSWTDVDNTLGMSIWYFILQVEWTMPSLIPKLGTLSGALEVVKAYMKDELPITAKEKADDCNLGWKSEDLIPAAQRLQEAMIKGERVSPYMNISYEYGGAFLGGQLLYPRDFSIPGLVVTGAISSFLIKQFSPEYGVQSELRDRTKAKRPYPGLAWGSMLEAYGTHPIYGEMRELIDSCWYDEYGYSYSGYRDDLLRRDRARLAEWSRQRSHGLGLDDLSQIDQDVIAHPEKLQYRYDPADVNPTVVDLLFQGVTADELEPYFDSVYRSVSCYN